MHESYLLKNLFRYLEKEEKLSAKKLIKIYISLSELGGISEEHFREHFRNEVVGTKRESLEIEIKKTPFGPELEITKLDFV